MISDISFGQIIRNINPEAKFKILGSDIDTCEIEWLENPTNITREQIKVKIQETQYQRDREKEYPTWQDQLDDIYHNGVAGWKATIKTTKDKYPKP